MSIFNKIKYGVLKCPLELKKTHDLCEEAPARLTVVFLHGIASDSTAFRNALRYLEGTTSLKNVRFVAFDLLGWGKSYKNSKLNYDYDEQLAALENSLNRLKIATPLILIGHSMGTLIASRYAASHKDAIRELVLCSPPVYTEDDLANPAMTKALKMFEAAVSVRNRKITKEKAFQGSMQNIVLDKKNYKTLINQKIPTTLIYGDEDKFIASFNIPKVLKENSCLTAIKTPGRHGMSREKYSKIVAILERELNETL